MSLEVVENILTLKLDMINTLALAALVLFLGYFVRRKWEILDRLNIPAPVVGGLIFALLALVFRLTDVFAFKFDIALQGPLYDRLFYFCRAYRQLHSVESRRTSGGVILGHRFRSGPFSEWVWRGGG